MGQEKLILLNLSQKEKRNLDLAYKDLVYFLGECEYKKRAFFNPDLLGQNWITLDNIDYVPSQVINNKVKPLINKQARFMLSKSPTLLFKPYDVKEDKDNTEALRQFVDDILETNNFWSEAMKAFKLATITRKVLLRLEANPGQPIKLCWHGINEFKYQVDPANKNNIIKVVLVVQDSQTANLGYDKQKWYRYTYEMKTLTEEQSCYLTTEVFMGNNLGVPISTVTQDTLLKMIPCWVIHNEKDMANPHGQSDLKDLKPLQNQLNRKLSDFSDALRFQMFGQDVFIDATPESVSQSKIAPNSVVALKSIDAPNGQKASYTKVENAFSSVAPVQYFLQYLDDEMHEKLAIPKPADLKNVPSAKAMKYLYIELIARCEEKWLDWEPPIREMLRAIIYSCIKFNCYDTWDSKWDNLLFNIILEKNYPLVEDEDDAKQLAMAEVAANVRSHRSYIKDFSNDEDTEEAFKEICEDLSQVTAASMEQFNQADNLDNPDPKE